MNWAWPGHKSFPKSGLLNLLLPVIKLVCEKASWISLVKITELYTRLRAVSLLFENPCMGKNGEKNATKSSSRAWAIVSSLERSWVVVNGRERSCVVLSGREWSGACKLTCFMSDASPRIFEKTQTANGRFLHHLFILKTNFSFADGVYISPQRWRIVLQKTWQWHNFRRISLALQS